MGPCGQLCICDIFETFLAADVFPRFGSSDIEASGKIEPENESDKKFTVSPQPLIYLQTFLSQVFCATKLIGGFFLFRQLTIAREILLDCYTT